MCFKSEADCNWAFKQLTGDEHADNLGRPEKRNAGSLGVTVRMSCSEGGRQFASSKVSALKSVAAAKKDKKRAAKSSAKVQKPTVAKAQESDDEDDDDDEDAATLVAANSESDEDNQDDEEDGEEEDADDDGDDGDDESDEDTENAAGAVKMATEEALHAASEAEDEDDEDLSVDEDSGSDSGSDDDDDEDSISDTDDELTTRTSTASKKSTTAKRKVPSPSSGANGVAGRAKTKLTAAAIANMKVAELRQACADRKLKKTGNKEELRQRLAAQIILELRERKAAKESMAATAEALPKKRKRQRISGGTSTEAVLDTEELVAFAKQQRPAWLAWLTKHAKKGKTAAKDPARHTEDDLRSFWQSLQ